MAHRQKTQQFKKSIRKQQIHQFFASKRIIFAEGLSVQTRQLPLIGDNNSSISSYVVNLSIDDIKRLAKLSETEPGIQIIAQSGSISSLITYLSAEYHNSDQQFFATHILSNYYYIKHSQQPNQAFMNQILQIMQKSNAKITQNCIVLLTNIIQDHPIFRDKLVKQKQFASRINRLYKIQKATIKYFISLVTLIYRTIYEVTFESSFKILIAPLNQIFTSNELLELDLIKLALKCFNLLTNMFTTDAAKDIIEGRILQRLFCIVPMFNDVEIIDLTLQLICQIIHQSLHSNFKECIVPFVNNIMQCSKQNKYLELSRQFKLKLFKVIYFSIQERLMTVKQFIYGSMAKLMLEEFKICNDPQILVELISTFSVVLLNLGSRNAKDQAILEQIEGLIDRAASMMPDNLQILDYIKKVAYLRENDI